MRTYISWLLLATVTISPPVLNADEFPPIKNTERAMGDPPSPADVVKNSKVPPGFQLATFAAEPQVQNPIAMTTDERGRVWVAENFSWAGNNAGGFDPQQRDRIVVLEDTDGDGQADRRTVFLDDIHKLTSIEVGHGGVWAIALPQLLFIPDRNRDDIPDGPPQVVLDGFNDGVVGHTPANGLKWGPDGWLYARHGIQATSSIGKPGASESQRVKINTGVWRYHPRREVVEAIMHGMTNSWGFDFNQHQEMFVINTVIGHLWHVVPGAHVRRMYGIDLNPHAYQLIEQTADHVHWDTGESWGDVKKGMTDKTHAAGGGHAHIGLMIYQGDNWPEEYRHRIYTLNLHGLRINSDILQREGAGFTAKHGPDLVHFADPWFRGMELITGPDGGVLIADWSDTGECHDHDGVHRTSGRIYKLTYGTPKPTSGVDLAKLTDRELLELQLHDNCWWVRQSQRLLTERADEQAKNPQPSELTLDLRRKLEEQVNVPRRLRLMSTLYSTGGTNSDWLVDRLAAESEAERTWALRLLLDSSDPNGAAPSASTLRAIHELARREKSGLVLLYLASALQRLPFAARWEVAKELIAHQEFAYDRMYPLMVWYGIEPIVPLDVARALKLVKQSKLPLVTQNIARRLTLELEREPRGANELVRLALENNDPLVATEILTGMAAALRGWQKAPRPEKWDRVAEVFPTAKNSAALNDALRALNIVFGDGRTLDELRKVAVNGQAEPGERQQAIRALAESDANNLAGMLQGLLGDRAVAAEAVKGLARFDHADTPRRILEKLGGFSPAARAEAVNTLVARPSYAKALLEAVKQGKIAKQEIDAFHARQVRSFNDPNLTQELAEVWGDVRESAAEKRALMETWRGRLTSQTLSQADVAKGRALFDKTCASCHVLFGNGRKIGPDLTGSNRKNLDYLLENILDPSASVAVDFRAVNVVLHNGRVISGVVSQESERTLTLQTAQEPVVIDRQEIEEFHKTTNSLMPDGLLQNLGEEQVRDLFGYLMSSHQVAAP